MREILYRGKAINRDKGYHLSNYKEGEWVYGLVTQLNEKLPSEMTDINGISNIEVDYETIGQYTRLTDKNGTMIFEGDIVDILTENEEIGVVVFDDGGFEVKADGFVVDFHSNINGTDLEVIGNIYDNPELL